MDVLDRIDAVCRRVLDRIAHRSEDRALAYAELRRRSDALAASIVRPLSDDRLPIVVFGHKEPEMLIGLLGAAKTGRPYVPLDSSLPRARTERTITAARAGLVLTPERVRELADGDDPAPPLPLHQVSKWALGRDESIALSLFAPHSFSAVTFICSRRESDARRIAPRRLGRPREFPIPRSFSVTRNSISTTWIATAHVRLWRTRDPETVTDVAGLSVTYLPGCSGAGHRRRYEDPEQHRDACP